MRILIVDDHEVVRRGLRDLLSPAYPGAEFSEATDSSQALTCLLGESWDLVLLDINMPGRSGLEVLQEARAHSPGAPVIILSAYPEEEFALRAFKLGASAYLNKSAMSHELLAAAERALAGRKYVTATLAEKLASSLGTEIQQAPHEALSQRELQVFQFVALGKTLKEIAQELHLSEKTVSTYRARITEKTGLAGNVEIARYALKHGLVD